VHITPVLGAQVNEPSFSIDVTAGPPSIINIVQGNNQTATPGQILPLALKVQVTDSAGNTLAKTPVQWSVIPAGSVTLSNVINTTDLNGQASATVTLGNTTGAFQVKVTAGAASATFNVTSAVPSAGIVSVSGDNQTAVINTAFGSPLVVKVVDASNNPVANVPVTFQVTSGSATLSPANPVTGNDGTASTTVTAGATAGPIVITATASNFNVTFNLTARLPGPANLAIVNGASFQASTGIAAGGIAIISGTGIVPGVDGIVTANNIVGPLPTVLPAGNGASALFGQTLAPIYYVMSSNGQDQMAVQVPFEVLPGPVTITVAAAGGGSSSFNATIQTLAPGVFTTTSAGQTFAVAVRPDGSFVTAGNPARRGEDITVYVTGLGTVSPATATGDVGIPNQTVVASLIVGLNNSGVPLVSAVYAPGMVGVYAITLTVPAGTTAGPAQPLGIIAFDAQNNVFFAQATYIPIQ